MNETDEKVDVPAVLKLPSVGSYALLAFFAVTTLALAYTAGGEPMQTWEGILALVIALASAVFALAAGPYPLARGRAVAIAGSPALVAFLIALHMNPQGAPGWTAWYVLSGTLVLLALAVRGRIALAWGGFAAMVAVNVVWATATGRDPLVGLTMMQAATAILVFGSLFAVGLRTLMRRLHTFSTAEHRRAADDAAAAATTQERRARMSELEHLVGEPLMLLASESPLSPEVRADFRGLEGQLRDQIRGGNLLTEPATAAVRAARVRGVDVVLLDDLGETELPVNLRSRLATIVADALDAVEDGSAIIRLSSIAPTAVTVSVVTETAGRTTRTTRVL